MNAPHGYAEYPGIAGVLDASVTLTPGVVPNVVRLRIVPQAQLPAEFGTLRLVYGQQVVELPDCRLQHASLERNARGEVWQVSLVDRRWKWRYGAVAGSFNMPTGANDPPDRARTPRELAAWYLEAMGEQGADISALPNDVRPPVSHDFDNPAAALADLCELLGCQVVLGLDNRVRLVRAGAGAELPTDGLLEDLPSVSIASRPPRIAVVCGPSLFQVDFPLEAVGLDSTRDASGEISETIRPLDELSYRPADGWSRADLPFFYNLAIAADGRDTSGLQPLAAKSVFRYYRLKLPVRVPGYADEIRELAQILPLEQTQLVLAPENGRSRPLLTMAFGVWHAGLDELGNTLPELMPLGDTLPALGPSGTVASPFVLSGFKLDTARGLLIFDEPVYQNATPDLPRLTAAPAQLILRAACQVRSADTGAATCHVRQRVLNDQLGTETLYLRHPDLRLTHVPSYAASGYSQMPTNELGDRRAVERITTNLAELNAECDRRIDAACREFAHENPRQVRLIGICPTQLDGALRQITYQVGPQGATTTICRHSELLGAALDNSARRRAARAQLLAGRTPTAQLLAGDGRTAHNASSTREAR